MRQEIMLRKPFQGLTNIVKFNWHLYLEAFLVATPGLLMVFLFHFPLWLKVIILSGVALALYNIASSLVVAYLVYDRSALYRWGWLKEIMPVDPARLVNIHAGFDEASEALQHLFPYSHLQVLDLYDPAWITEISIRRARHYYPARVPAQQANPAALPLADASCDSLLLYMTAHELRSTAEKVRFFQEVARVLAPGGKVILTEHIRDHWGFIAFGPGFFHFFPRREWLKVIKASGMTLVQERTITPFVHVFVAEKVS